jgi:hypothetical protein
MGASSRMPEDRRIALRGMVAKSGRKRPIVLEIADDSPDDRVRLSKEDPHPEGSELEEAIDSLMSEDDAVRADADPTTEPQAPDAEPPASSELSEATLEAIDSIEKNAQSLVEDAIDRLLEEDPLEDSTDDEPQSAAPEESSAEEQAFEPEMSPEDLEAELDALETSDATPAPVHDDLEELANDLGTLESDSAQEAQDDPTEIPEAEAATAEESESVEEPTDEHTEESDLPEPEAQDEPEQTEEVEDTTPAESPSGSDEDAEEPEDDDLLNSIAQELMELEDASTSAETDDLDASEPTGGVDGPESEAADDASQPTQTAEALVESSDLEADPLEDAIDQIMNSTETEESGAEAETESEPTAATAPEPETETEAETASESDDASGEPQNAEEDEGDPDQILEDASTLADLDATLAGLGDVLLTGDFETPDGEVIGSDDLGIQDATSLLDQLDIGDLDLDSENMSTEPGEQSQEPLPASEPMHEPAASATQAPETPSTPQSSEPAPVPATATQTPRVADQGDETPIPEVESIWQTTNRVAANLGRAAWREGRTHAGPLSAKLVELVNKPVRDRPAVVRDSIGYIAMWTGLLAMILWVYLVFVRESPTPTPTQAPSRMVEPGDDISANRTTRLDP